MYFYQVDVEGGFRVDVYANSWEEALKKLDDITFYPLITREDGISQGPQVTLHKIPLKISLKG